MKRQLTFIGFEKMNAKVFGGTHLKGNPREARPISTKRPMHLVMRSSHATGKHSFLKKAFRTRIREIIHRVGKKKGVKIYQYANGGNHLHLIVLPKNREAFHSFIRTITGLIARMSLSAERGKAKGLTFWDARPFTRILEWGGDYKTACNYLLQNTLEALGFIHYAPRISRGGRGPPINPSPVAHQ